MYVIDEQREEQEIQAKYEELIAACRNNYPISQDEEEEIFRAFSVAKRAHAGTRRKSGEPLFIVRSLRLRVLTTGCCMCLQ